MLLQKKKKKKKISTAYILKYVSFADKILYIGTSYVLSLSPLVVPFVICW